MNYHELGSQAQTTARQYLLLIAYAFPLLLTHHLFE